MITFNHENFIIEAIQSILIQETDFAVELIISNDASTDKSDSIIKHYINNHPKSSCIKYINHTQNIGMMNNLIATLKMCKGKYLAFCEGDDYWIDKNKLQKQVDFLDSNSTYNICFHNVKIREGNKFSQQSLPNDLLNRNTFSIKDLAKTNFISTPSVVYRNNIVSIFPTWFKQSPVGDHVLHLLHAQNGDVFFMEDEMAVYRKHINGVWSMEQNHSKSTKIKWVSDKMDAFFKYKYHTYFYSKIMIDDYYLNKLLLHKKQGKILNYFSTLLSYFSYKRKVKKSYGAFLLLAKQYFNKNLIIVV